MELNVNRFASQAALNSTSKAHGVELDSSKLNQTAALGTTEKTESKAPVESSSQPFQIYEQKFMGENIRETVFDKDERYAIYKSYSNLASQAKSNLSQTVFDMRDAYTGVQESLYTKNAQLLEKDWDFSIDKDGELFVIEGKDKLSRGEKEIILDTLKANDMDALMKDIAKSTIDFGVGMRGPEQWASDGIGKYDITDENIGDILRGREMMADTQFRLVNREDEAVMRFKEKYNDSKMTPLEAVWKQLQVRGEEKYNYDYLSEVNIDR